jgi:hypothetical protein
MRTGDLTTGATKLHKAWKKLRERWEETKPHWSDSVSRDFEENCMEKLEPQVITTLERMRGLAAFLGGAEHECER